jgi:type I restriction enzyme S subunit
MRWLYYAIVHYKLGTIDDGSPIPSTTRSAVYVRDVLVPPKEKQRAIASILGALDDKIDLNRRMNETLEAMARAIFKDWFVDFGPVRAKAEGRQPPGLAPDIAALFPDALDGEDKPVGWTSGKLLDLCQLKRGYDLPTVERRDGPFPIVSSSGVSGRHHQRMATGPGVVTGRYGTIGEVFFMEEDFWPLNTALYVCDFKGHEPRFVYYALSGIDFMIYSDKGAVPGINRNHLHEHPVTCSPVVLQRAFAHTLQPLFERQRLNRAETETLVALRDLLLPKLMSGEIRIRDAERAVA